MKPKISIIDYGMGNIFSIKCALDAQGLDSVFTDNIQDITKEVRDLKNNNPEQLEELERLATEGNAGNINKIFPPTYSFSFHF